jgi:hypothetical protein
MLGGVGLAIGSSYPEFPDSSLLVQLAAGERKETAPETSLRTQPWLAAETSGHFSGHRIDSTDRSTSSIGQYR